MASLQPFASDRLDRGDLMRLLCTSDIHYRLPQLDWLVGQADDFDLVVLPGDHLHVVDPVALEIQIVVVSKYLDRLAARAVVLASSGNHDLDGSGDHGEKFAGWLGRLQVDGLYVDGDSFDLDGVRFTVSRGGMDR